ncbi:Uncharacterised protein [Campylobacter jejuni]|jgi:hypothetical protein|nr:Uncharacterised protein [Campylobacter jejuni]
MLEIQIILDRVIKILSENNEENFSKVFAGLKEELRNHNNDALYALKRLFGGAGSFNDLVLHKNGQMLRSENDELDGLRHKLYDLLMDEIANAK